MKAISESVGEGRVRQVLTPGVIAAAGLHAYVQAGLARLESLPADRGAILFVVEVIVFGIVVSSAVNPIIQTYEGFRLPLLTRWLRPRHERRVERWHGELYNLVHGEEERSPEARARASQLTVALSDYPFGTTAEGPAWFVDRPTLLGNIIASYELYPRGRYGVDGQAFWFHFVYLAPEPARKDLLDAIRFAESLVLGSAAGAVVGVIGMLNLLGLAIGIQVPALAVSKGPAAPEAALIAVILGVLAFLGCYHLALSAYREARSSFQALIDLTWPAFSSWLSKAPTTLPPKAQRDRGRDVREFLATPIEAQEEDQG